MLFKLGDRQIRFRVRSTPDRSIAQRAIGQCRDIVPAARMSAHRIGGVPVVSAEFRSLAFYRRSQPVTGAVGVPSAPDTAA